MRGTHKEGTTVLEEKEETVPTIEDAQAPQMVRTSQIMWGVFFGMTLWSILAGFVFYVIIDIWMGWAWLYYLLKGSR